MKMGEMFKFYNKKTQDSLKILGLLLYIFVIQI